MTLEARTVYILFCFAAALAVAPHAGDLYARWATGEGSRHWRIWIWGSCDVAGARHAAVRQVMYGHRHGEARD